MARMIDQIRASKLPSNMMQFAAKGALNVSPAENIEILVYLAKHNKVFGELARMTLAGWDEKASLHVASDPQSPPEVLDYLVSPDNLRPKLLPALLENPSVRESELAKFAISASAESIGLMLRSPRIRSAVKVLDALKPNPYLKKEQLDDIKSLLKAGEVAARGDEPTPDATPESIVPAMLVVEMQVEPPEPVAPGAHAQVSAPTSQPASPPVEAAAAPALVLTAPEASGPATESGAATSEEDEAIAAYFFHHATEIAADEGKPFQAIGGIVELLGNDYFPVSPAEEVVSEPEPETHPAPVEKAAEAPKAVLPAKPPEATKRVNTVQKINALDVKGRIQLALKGSKEERSILVRDGTKVVALAVLEAPKLSDGEVEKFASQKNVLEAVLRQIPLKRRFMKNYKVVRNLVSNPRTPLDLGLGLMKNLLSQDLKNIANNKEISETIRKLAMKMFQQKEAQANKK
jgi:cell division septation protein DedD